MANYRIRCEAIRIAGDRKVCPGSAQTRLGETFVIGPRTPEPMGMCGRAFSAMHPMALAMRFAEKVPLEDKEGCVKVTCPDGSVEYRLSRVRD